MGDRRARRPAVDYAVAFDFDDDDDFVDSSSSSSSRGASQEKQQKKKEKTKKSSEKSSRAANDENASKSESPKEKKTTKKKSAKELKEVDLNGGIAAAGVTTGMAAAGVTTLPAGVTTLQSFLSSPNRRMERKSLDEKRFERELEMAMKLSKQVCTGCH